MLKVSRVPRFSSYTLNFQGEVCRRFLLVLMGGFKLQGHFFEGASLPYVSH